jgi:hypothetical protein
MMNEEEKPFPVRAYTKSELAGMYNPGLSSESARRILRQWMKLNRSLMSELKSHGYSDRIHFLTPAQVSVIVRHLGEP